MDGIINIYKEKGFTSHDVVAKMRGILKQKKIGHTGTLDPDATGVLPICLGKATKVCDLLTNQNKTYEAVILLGVETDTEDISGTVISKQEVTLTSEEVEEAVLSFKGKSMQIPPMYSALKVNGKKLYELAREGKEIERKPRPIEIFEIKIMEMELPYLTVEVTCSKGTYIRSLARDIGKKLGVGGCILELKRTRVRDFLIKDSITLEELEKRKAENSIEEILMPVDTVFSDYKEILVKKEGHPLIYNGNYISTAFIKNQISCKDQESVRVYDDDMCFIAIYQWEEKRKQFKPKKMFLLNEK